MTWITDNKGQGPWDLSLQPDKWGYLNNPKFTTPASDATNYSGDPTSEPQVWSTEQGRGSSGTQVGHNPCGHWHKLPMEDGPGSSRKQVPGSIGYTSQQMNINEQQTFTFINADGVVAPLPGGCIWAVTAGGGMITQEGVYTAPSHNADCRLNPTISIVCNGVIRTSLNVAVNGYADLGVAAVDIGSDDTSNSYCEYEWISPGVYKWHWVRWCFTKAYNCAGALFSSTDNPRSQGRTDACWDGAAACSSYGGGDLRTSGMKAGGCCPVQLL